MADLLAMSRTFTKESQTLSTAVSAAGVSTPDGGDATINAALAAALQAAGLTTGQLGAVVDGHGTKLDGAYQQYRKTEENNAQLCQQLTSLITGK
jgi:hypothetical protein